MHLVHIVPTLIPCAAPPFEEVQRKVFDIIDKKVLVGHAIQNDLEASLAISLSRFINTVAGAHVEAQAFVAARHVEIQAAAPICSSHSASHRRDPMQLLQTDGKTPSLKILSKHVLGTSFTSHCQAAHMYLQASTSSRASTTL